MEGDETEDWDIGRGTGWCTVALAGHLAELTEGSSKRWDGLNLPNRLHTDHEQNLVCLVVEYEEADEGGCTKQKEQQQGTSVAAVAPD